MLMPKRVKHRKQMRGRMKGKAQRGNFLAYGDYGLVATQPGWITSNQIEAARHRHDPLHQAWRPGLDQDFPGQARDRKAGRDPNGFR